MIVRPASRTPFADSGLRKGHPLLRSMTSLYAMSEGAGPTLHDWSGSAVGGNRDVAFSGTAAWNPGGRGGRYGQSVGHTAVAGTGILGTTGLTNLFSTSTATLAVWWKPGNTSAPANAAAQNGSNIIADSARVIGIARTNVSSAGDMVHFYNNDGAIDVVSTTYSNTDWNFDVLVHSGGTLFGYHNGQLAGSTASGNSTSLAGSLQIASSGTGRCLIGCVDFAATWSRALDANEIRSLYDRPLQIFRPRRLPWLWSPDASVLYPDTVEFDLPVSTASFRLAGCGPAQSALKAGAGTFRLTLQ